MEWFLLVKNKYAFVLPSKLVGVKIDGQKFFDLI